ncbi:ABC transporter permease [Kordia sp. YSTF-M3]|uniref:ABC transporter permease n=1 Tax=Kordia aestuariivivens TaxID=2759037 RepID=A0ABR7Q523_9FLAO|nr:ABC transporter permease [Kordia aestuariivivens]MBC8753670.1 ABC transporter permease [Kordia aestuariivivens]
MYRHIDEFGVIPLIGFAILIALYIWVSEAIFKNMEQASYIYMSIGLLLSLKLGSVKRNIFLKKCFLPEAYWKVRILENTLFVLPFSSFLCYKQAFIEALIIHSCAIALSFFNTIGMRSITIPTPFGKKPFEFVIGFRNTFWVFPLLYTLTFIAISVNNYNLGIFSLIGAFVCCMSYYSKQEPLYYIWVHSMSPKEFLNHKIKTALLFSSILLLPIAIGLSFFFPLSTLQITALFLLLGFCFICVTILGKYSNYPSQVPIAQAFAMLISILFPPLLLLIIPLFYKRAIKNLNSILTC